MMFESPLLKKFVAGRLHQAVLNILKDRFGTVPCNVTRQLREVLDEEKLQELILVASKCPDCQAFRDGLLN
jgi:hypothetical protein